MFGGIFADLSSQFLQLDLQQVSLDAFFCVGVDMNVVAGVLESLDTLRLLLLTMVSLDSCMLC